MASLDTSALEPQRGLKATPETMRAAQIILNKLYEADHQTLFELVKLMAMQTAAIVRAEQGGGEMPIEEAFVDGMQFANYLLPDAEAEAKEGYRPVPVAVWKPEGGEHGPA